MKEIRPVHIVVAVVLALFSMGIVHWVILPKNGLPKTAEFTENTVHPEELPTLPQNELYNSPVTLPPGKRLSSFEETTGQEALEPKPAATNKKEEL